MFKSSSKFQGFKGKRKRNIGQLFCATDFESLMYPCFTFCRILGILPYKINAPTIKICKRRYVISTIIICILSFYGLICFYYYNTDKNIKDSIPKKLQAECFFIFNISLTVSTFILHKPRMRLIQTILKFSLKLPTKSYQNLSKLIHAKDILGFFFLIVVHFVVYFVDAQSAILPRIVSLYVSLVRFQMDMLYMNCVCILKACFKQINDNLANLREFETNDEPCIMKRTYYKQRNLILLMELKALKKQHLAISDTVQMLNMIFSLQLLIMLIMAFIDFTFLLYYVVMHWKIGMMVKAVSNHSYNLTLILFMMFFCVKFILIVWACETGKNQAKEISNTVHNVLNSISDEQTRYELQLFSLQLLHCGNVFSTKAVIIDATLITEMMGNITTYLLILIQFLFMSNSCDKESI